MACMWRGRCGRRGGSHLRLEDRGGLLGPGPGAILPLSLRRRLRTPLGRVVAPGCDLVRVRLVGQQVLQALELGLGVRFRVRVRAVAHPNSNPNPNQECMTARARLGFAHRGQGGERRRLGLRLGLFRRDSRRDRRRLPPCTRQLRFLSSTRKIAETAGTGSPFTPSFVETLSDLILLKRFQALACRPASL